jgi:hypothetical protein
MNVVVSYRSSRISNPARTKHPEATQSVRLLLDSETAPAALISCQSTPAYRPLTPKMLLKKASGAPVKSMLVTATPACAGSIAMTVS